MNPTAEPFTTVRAIAATLAIARERHASVAKAADDLKEARDRAPEHDLDGLWLELTDQTPAGEPSDLVDIVHATMPTALVPIIKGGRTDIAAAFTFTIMCLALVDVEPTDRMGLREAMTKVWPLVQERAQLGAALAEGFGRDDSAGWLTARRVEQVHGRKFLKTMASIAQMAGRMHTAMRATAKTTSTRDPQSIVGVEQGGELDRITPDELALLKVDQVADIQAMRILQQQATQDEMAGERSTCRGPLVIVKDESGSMHDPQDLFGNTMPGRNSWAAATALALVRIAHSEDRRAACVHFGGSVVVQDLPKDDGAALEDMIMMFISGGTNFVRPLKAAIDRIEDLEREGYPGGDVVYVTDGEEEMEHNQRPALNALLDGMAKTGVRLWTVGIGKELAPSFPLRARAERYVFAHDESLKNRQRATQLATELTAAAVADPKRWN